MFYEIERLRREAFAEETVMPTEAVRCSKCSRSITFTAKEGQEMFVRCPCGHIMVVVIEARGRQAA